MCQLCAVIVTGNRVFRRDGVRHHSNLRELLIVDYPNEVADGVEAEFDLLARQWGYGDARAVLAKVGPERARLLYQFEQENFVDADAFIRFVEHAGPPNRRDGDATLCLTVGAENDYEAKCAPLYADYEAKRAPLYADYKAKCAPLYADYEAKRDALYADYEAKRDALYADYEAKRAPLYADYEAKRAPLYADYKAKCAPLYADYEAKRAAFWINLFANPENRIAVWR